MNNKATVALVLLGVGSVAAFAEVLSSGGGGKPAAVAVVSGAAPASTPAAGAAIAAAADTRFDAAWYLRQNPDVAAAGMDAYDHYNRYGRWEGRLPYAGAAAWHPDPSSPSIYASAPGCNITVTTPYDEGRFDGAWYLQAYPDVAAARMDPWDHFSRYGRREGRLPYAGASSSASSVWAPAGSRQVRIRFKLTRFKDGTPCERSYAITGGASWPSGAPLVGGSTPINIAGQPQVMAVGEALSLPAQGSQGELVVNIPADVAARGQPGYFHVWMRSAEYNPIVRAEFDVYVGGTRPAASQYEPSPLTLAATPDYPSLGQPTYGTTFAGDLAADGWTFAPGVQLNGMSGVFTAPSWRTASGKPTNNYTPVTDANGERPLALVLRDHGGDLVNGKRWSAPMISRLLGQGGYGFRRTVQTLPPPMPGTDAGAPWGIRHGGGWPPEFDTHEGFVGDPRVYQTVHMPNGLTTSFTPRVDIVGKHEWMEEFGRQNYRLWIDHKLVVEHPNYLAGEVLDTTFSIEGPGGAGGAVDLSQKYDGLSLLLYNLAWWQR